MGVLTAAEVKNITVGKALSIVFRSMALSIKGAALAMKSFLVSNWALIALGVIYELYHAWDNYNEHVAEINKAAAEHAKEAYDFIAFCTGAEASKTFLSMDYFPAWQDENTVATYCEGKTAPEHIEFVVNQDIISQVPCDPLYNAATNIVKAEVSLYLLGEQDIETTEANCLARIKDEVVDAQ